MCGIFCLLMMKSGEGTLTLQKTAQGLLKKCRVCHRGPDCTKTIEDSAVFRSSLYLEGYVLHLRGIKLIPQPAQCGDGGSLLWNGEIFGGVEILDTENDTAWLSHKLENLDESGEDAILNLFSLIQGPWAFLYYQRHHSRLWFGRDRLGRRSLLWQLPSTTDADSSLSLLISSVAIEGVQLTVVPTDGLYCMDLRTSQLTLYPWTTTPSGGQIFPTEICYALGISSSRLDVKRTIIRDLETRVDIEDQLSSNLEELFEKTSTIRNDYRDKFEDVLSCAVRRRVELQSSVCGMCIQSRLKESNYESVLFTEHCSHARVAVLFSGGIDSMMVAAMAHRHVPSDEPIDLLNVAFRKKPKPEKRKPKPEKRRPKSDDVVSADDYCVPDRVTGLAGWEELKVLYPDREWIFFNIDITPDELKEERDANIRHLVSPLRTVLDDSIGCAIWFAARGRGRVQTGDGGYQERTSTARVLLLGMGADEQLGGYTRHRTAFRAGDLCGLVDELRLDIDRISERNLGRDDRIVSDHGKEARFPFLDEQVVSFLNSLPCQYKMDLDLPRGYGEKFLLRHLAHKMGLKSCVTLPKRAIQFGSRIAKLEDSKEKASDTCDRLDGMKLS